MGTLIILEGGDGSGKATQTKLLVERLIKEGHAVKSVSFPNYDSGAAMPIKMYLAGEFGKDVHDVNPYVASSMYAIDRFASFRTDWEEFYKNGGIIIADRYTTSNMVHQMVKYDDQKERTAFLDWLEDFEFKKFGLPTPDAVCLLDMPLEVSEALMAVYKLFWDEFSSWYLEMVKPGYQQPIDKATYEATLGFFDALLRLLHPFMPFITEELWQALEPRKEGESLMVAQMPEVAVADSAYLDAFEIVKEIVGGVRTIRLQKNIPNKDALELQIVGEHNEAFNAVIAKMCNLSSISKVEEKAAGAVSFLVRTTEYAVPLGNLINVEEELAKLQEELKYQKGFLTSVMKKLGNENFVSKAPAKVIEMEKKKQADAESKIKSIEESIAALTK